MRSTLPRRRSSALVPGSAGAAQHDGAPVFPGAPALRSGQIPHTAGRVRTWWPARRARPPSHPVADVVVLGPPGVGGRGSRGSRPYRPRGDVGLGLGHRPDLVGGGILAITSVPGRPSFPARSRRERPCWPLPNPQPWLTDRHRGGRPGPGAGVPSSCAPARRYWVLATAPAPCTGHEPMTAVEGPLDGCPFPRTSPWSPSAVS